MMMYFPAFRCSYAEITSQHLHNIIPSAARRFAMQRLVALLSTKALGALWRPCRYSDCPHPADLGAREQSTALSRRAQRDLSIHPRQSVRMMNNGANLPATSPRISSPAQRALDQGW